MTDSIDRHLRKALRALNNGEMRKVKAACHAALAVDSVNADAMHLLGLVWRQEGNLEQSLHWLRKTVGANPSFAGAWYNLADTLVGVGDFDDAENAYLQALDLARGAKKGQAFTLYPLTATFAP